MTYEPFTTLYRVAGLVIATLALVVITLLSLRVGSIEITMVDVIHALLDFDSGSYEQLVVRSQRLPRTIIGIGVGAALAVAGAAMQAATRNPLAGPGILGVNSGAAFGVVTAVFFLGITHPFGFIWFAFAGGLLATTVVFMIGSAGPGGASPIKLALAGVVVSALLGSWTTALVLFDEQSLDVMRFWSAGSLSGRTLDVFFAVAPFLVIGVVALLLLSDHLNILSLDEDSARALGMNTTRMRAFVSVVVVLIAGAAVAVAGPIGFVGLAVPHIVRWVSGPDYRWVIGYCVIVGPVLLVSADILGRVIARPSEVQVGIVTAMVGAPFLIALARRRKVAAL